MHRPRILLTLSAIALALTGCGSGSGDDAGQGDSAITAVASFYPLQEAAERVGGEHAFVTNLTKPGAEPHDLELTPKQVLEAKRADALIYLKDFQPSVDDAAQTAGDTAMDVTPFARLDLDNAEHDHGDEGSHAGHDHGATDPHFWLDPTRYADVVTAIGERFAKIDPAHAADYRANAQDFVGELTGLDGELESGLADCRSTDLVTGHAAFAYFADRYGFHQESVSGLTPGAEPSPTALASLIRHIKDEKIGTVYAETLVPQDTADTIARDTGATVAVLDPIEGLTDASAGDDYLSIMRSNLTTVERGQGCS